MQGNYLHMRESWNITVFIKSSILLLINKCILTAYYSKLFSFQVYDTTVTWKLEPFFLSFHNLFILLSHSVMSINSWGCKIKPAPPWFHPRGKAHGRHPQCSTPSAPYNVHMNCSRNLQAVITDPRGGHAGKIAPFLVNQHWGIMQSISRAPLQVGLKQNDPLWNFA